MLMRPERQYCMQDEIVERCVKIERFELQSPGVEIGQLGCFLITIRHNAVHAVLMS
jgi:hypothetical protein